MKIYDGIFSALYTRNKRLGELSPWPICVGLTVSTVFILMSIFEYVSYSLGHPKYLNIDRDIGYVFFFIIFGVFYYRYVRRNRYKELAKEFIKLSPQQKTFWRILSFLYIAFSILITIASFTWVYGS